MAALGSGAGKPQEVAAATKIYSYTYGRDCKRTWHALGQHAREKMGLRSMTRLNAEHVRSFLESKIAQGVTYDTFAKICAHIGKFENALGLLAAAKGYADKATYDFRAVTQDKDLRDKAKGQLSRWQKDTPNRCFVDAAGVIAEIEAGSGEHAQDYALSARLQLEGGCRQREASLIRPAQLLGLGHDEHTGKEVGRVKLLASDTKGGKEREIQITPRTYAALEKAVERAQAQGQVWRVPTHGYRAAVSRAAQRAGESERGTHSLRYGYAAGRFSELLEHGQVHEEAIQTVSWEMGHERADITLHYLR
jgi:integrase